MWRCLAPILLSAAVAHADPDFGRCAETGLSAVPEPDRAQLTLYVHGRAATYWDEHEKKALAEAYDPLGALLVLAFEANDLHDTTRVTHFTDLMETTASKLPSAIRESDGVSREGVLAQAQALAGHMKEARAHLAAGEALAAKIKEPVPSAYRQLWTAAILMKDDAAAAREQKAYLATRDGRKDLGVTARLMSYNGAGRALVKVAEDAGPDRDRVLHMMVEGVEARGDYALAAEILAKEPARQRLMDAHYLTSMTGDHRHDPLVVASVKAATAVADDPTVDDVAREDIIEAATEVGLGRNVRAIADKIQNPWERAEAEAKIAADLALTDKAAAIELARAAVARSKTKGARKNVDNDTSARDQATWYAAMALARAGKLAEAKKLSKTVWGIDEMLGIRDDPKALAAWWKSTTPSLRVYALAHASKRDPLLGDPSYLAPFCP